MQFLAAQFILPIVFRFGQGIGDQAFGRRARSTHFDEFQVGVLHKLAPKSFRIESGEADHEGILA
jgi:hypothetical protein